MSDLFWRLLGIPLEGHVETAHLYWGAGWVRFPGLVLATAAFFILTVVSFYYARLQHILSWRSRVLLISCRALALIMLAAIALQPILVVKLQRFARPGLWLVIDDTESMTLVDRDQGPHDHARNELDVRSTLPQGTSRPDPSAPPSEQCSRSERVRRTLAALDRELLAQLEQAFRVRIFKIQRGDGVDAVTFTLQELVRTEENWPKYFSANGPVTALGAALLDLNRKRAGATLAGVILVSDFNHNAGIAPEAVVAQLQTPLFCVGVGDIETHDLAVDVQLPPMMKKDEKSVFTVSIRQEGLTGSVATLRVFARQVEEQKDDASDGGELPSDPQDVRGPTDGSRVVSSSPETAPDRGVLLLEEAIPLSEPVVHREVAYVPKVSGQIFVTAEVDPLPWETLPDNNRVTREGTVREYYVRVLFIEDEPSWEWRFIKEVFHRDPLVGPEGFRTFLRSADPRVRAENPLFLPTLALSRREFFSYDVVIIGDVPATSFNRSLMEMLREFVAQMGGGVIFSVGPRFGPSQWAETPLSDLLPVEIAPLTRLREGAFRPQRTPEAGLFDFMMLGQNAEENTRAWNNLGTLPWYFPVTRVRPLARVLLAHPQDTCIDGKTLQPLIAIQKLGRGEVIYIGCNEMWRLRRKYGDLYYRQFWGQLIHRLAIQHALGANKRFLVRSDRKEYRSGDEVRFTVEAYNADFRPLTEDQIPGGQLDAVLSMPPGVENQMRKIPLTLLRPGQFEGHVTVFAPGEYRLGVRDPLSDQVVETSFKVASQSIEKQQSRRSKDLQDRLATMSGGKAYELSQLEELLRNLPHQRQKETQVVQVELWNSWMFFSVVIGCLLCEWAIRKWLYLR